MKYVIRNIPYGWKITAIVVQRANSAYTSRPIEKLGLVTRKFGYRYIEVNINLLGYWLYHGARYESSRETNRAMDMVIQKWRAESSRALKRKDSIVR